MKSLAIITVIFSFAIGAASPQQETTPTKHENRPTQQPSTTITVNNEEHSNHDGNKPTDGPQGWHKLVTWPEGITAWALIATLIVFCIQANLMRVHAKELSNLAESAANNAESAKLSAQAVVNAERAWLVIGFVKTNNTNGGALSEFAFTCRNPGKTPATVKRIDMGYSVVQNPLDLPVPMRKEDLRSVELPGKTFIVSTDSFPIKAKVKPEEILYDKGRKDDFATGDESVVFYGRIVYCDVLDSQKPRETRWCYGHDRAKDTLVRIGPDEYNSHT